MSGLHYLGKERLTMSDNKKEALEESLKGYKEKVPQFDKSTLTWDKNFIFIGRTQRGYEIEYDANLQWGCKPTDSLLLSLAGCLAIDMVMFLKKMRVDLAEYKIDMVGERNPVPPQYYKKIAMHLHIAGKNLDSGKIDRAISLSQKKYCSVYHSLRSDLKVEITYTLEDKEPAPKEDDLR
jgi:putative redox protein